MELKTTFGAGVRTEDSDAWTLHRRHSQFAAGVGLAAAVLIALTGTPAQASDFSLINVWNSNHCLDNAAEDASKLQMWSCSGGSEQNWLVAFNSWTSLFTFVNQRTGRCITAPGSGGGTVAMATCNGANLAQQWRVYYADNPVPSAGWYTVWQNASSGLCLSTPSVGNGTRIQTTPCDPSDQYDRWHQR